MPRETESVCCQEIEAVRNQNLELVAEGIREEPPNCIVDHPGFEGVCLNRWVLETAWYQYRQYYGNNQAHEGPSNRRHRHVAYRQLVRWCWKVLGKEIRVVLPSCAVSRIREQFPLSDNQNNFEGFHYADE